MSFQIPSKPKIPPATHKGQYGKVLVIGGSPDYYGSPILTALGAEYSGADLVTLCLPKEHSETAKNYSLNFFVKTFHKPFLTEADVGQIEIYAQNCHVVVMGTGLGKDKSTQNAVLKILENLSVPVVLDAEALFPEILTVKKTQKRDWILTPHQKEFERVFQTPFSPENLKKKALQHNLTVLVKGHVDYVATPENFYENHTGCVEMRVGGTGDVLAGIVASYRSQRLNSFQAACAAVYYYGKAGEELAKRQTCFSACALAKFYSKFKF